MRPTLVTCVLGFVLCALAAPAVAVAAAPPWTLVEAGYNNVNVDDIDDSGSGAYLAGSFGGKNFHVFANYSGNSTDDFDLDLNRWFVGGGWHGLFGEKADLFGDLAYVNREVGPVDDSGWFGRVGIRWRLIKLLEIGANGRYESMSDLDSDTIWALNATLYVWRLGIGLNYETEDEVDTYSAFVRFVFGQN